MGDNTDSTDNTGATGDCPSDEPLSAADPRPDGEPYYIDTVCPECGTALILYDELTPDQRESSEQLLSTENRVGDGKYWYDEFVCPECLDGVYLDWPESHKNGVFCDLDEGE